jgi:pyruvate kinase
VARILAENIKAKVLLVSGGEELGRAISGLRPELPVFLICKDERGRRQALLSWGIFPVVAKDAATAMKILKKNKKIKNGNKIVVVSAGKIYVEIA